MASNYISQRCNFSHLQSRPCIAPSSAGLIPVPSWPGNEAKTLFMSHDIEHCEASSVTVFSDLSNLTILLFFFFFFWKKKNVHVILYPPMARMEDGEQFCVAE